MSRRFDIRNPPLPFRVFIVAAVFSVYGGLGGLMVALIIGHCMACIIMGAIGGAVAGAMLEARGS